MKICVASRWSGGREEIDWKTTLIQRQGETFSRAARSHKFIELNRVGFIPSYAKPSLSSGASGREDDVFPDTDGIAGEFQGFVDRNSEAQLVRNTFCNRCPAITIECRGEIQKLAAAQGAEASIQMVEAAIDEFERNNFSVKMRTEDREDADIRSLSISAEPVFREAQEIPRALKMNACFYRHHFIAMLTKPMLKVNFFSLPFRIPEATHDGGSSDHDAGIGRKYEIGQPGNGRHSFEDDAKILFKHAYQFMPLSHRPSMIHVIGQSHPGIDLILNSEKIRRTDKNAAHVALPNSLASSERNEAASMTRPTA